MISLPDPHDGNLWHGEREAGRRWNGSGEDVFEGVRVVRGGRDGGRPLVVPLVNVLVDQSMMKESAMTIFLSRCIEIH